MKILHTVESYYPAVGGMPEVVKQLSERLSRLGHDVTIATSYNSNRQKTIINGVKIEQFKISGNLVNGIIGTEKEIRRYEELVKNGFDVVINFAAQQWATDLILPILKDVHAKKIFVPTGFSALYFPEYKKYFEDMRRWMKEYDANVVLSNDYQDTQFARQIDAKKIILIPNGAAKDEFTKISESNIKQKLAIPEKDLLILDVGSHTGIKGHYEALKIFKKAKIKNATLLIIGNKIGGAGCTFSCTTKSLFWKYSWQRNINNKKLIIVDLPRSDVVTAYQQADLFLFTSNLECSPIVLFESMASSTPFLVTDTGNSKEIIEWTNAGILLPTIKKLPKKHNRSILFIHKIWSYFIGRKTYSPFTISIAKISESTKILEQLCNDKEKRLMLSKNGYESWLDRFTWENISVEYENLYKSLLQQ